MRLTKLAVPVVIFGALLFGASPASATPCFPGSNQVVAMALGESATWAPDNDVQRKINQFKTYQGITISSYGYINNSFVRGPEIILGIGDMVHSDWYFRGPFSTTYYRDLQSWGCSAATAHDQWDGE